MKKISYFGKEYTVGDDIKWVATSSSGNVIAFTEKPEMYRDTWVTYESGKRIGILGGATKDWKSSLIKVEDILVKEGHPHADLMLKYAMIAQYDDKPWECFECDVGGGGWVGMIGTLFHDDYNYRLKPQVPKIQVGQIWISKEEVEVTVINLANKLVFTKIEVGGLTIPWSFKQNVFFGNFKRKE